MNIDSELPPQPELEKPFDWLPEGPDFETEYVEWRDWDKEEGSKEKRGLFKRIGNPRIEEHPFFEKFKARVEAQKEGNSEKLRFFEAGCGHGNDLRVVIDLFKEKGIDVGILGVEYSEKEIKDGLKHYKDKEAEKEAQRETTKSLAQGDLRDLENIKFYDPESGEFSKIEGIKDNTFGVVYFEAILHAFGMGKTGSYREKRENAMKMLRELYRVAQPGAMFFGRASVFGPDKKGEEERTISFEDQLKLLRENEEWRFFPKDEEEFKQMLKEAGFEDIKTKIMMRKNEERPQRKNTPRLAFLCRKSESKE